MNDTNALNQLVQQVASAASAPNLGLAPADWHGLTWLHGCAGVAAIYATHVNWPKILAAFCAIQSYCDTRTGGLAVLAFRFIFGRPAAK